MAYTLYDKTMGTETKTSKTFWGLDYDSTHDYELVGVTSLGVAIRWTHRHGEEYDYQDCRIKCSKCDTWMAIDPKYIDRVRDYKCAECMAVEFYEPHSAHSESCTHCENALRALYSGNRPMRAASF